MILNNLKYQAMIKTVILKPHDICGEQPKQINEKCSIKKSGIPNTEQ